MNSVKACFDEIAETAINDGLATRIVGFSRSFANKNEEHIEFFGGHLIGVHTVRFTTQDRDRWFENVILALEEDLKDYIHDLPTINTNWFVSSDIMNLSCIWLVHKLNQAKLNGKKKEDAMREAIMVLQYKFLTSMLAHWFRYKANPAVAEATYAALSNRFGLKQHGTWQRLLEYKARETLSKSGVFRDVVDRMDDDERVIGMVNYIQVYIKDILKNITAVFYQIQDDPKSQIRTSSGTALDLDGNLYVKDINKFQTQYLRYIQGTILDRGSFIKPELVEAITSQIAVVSNRVLIDTLTYLSDNYGKRGDKRIAPFIEGIVMHTFEVLEDLKPSERRLNDLPTLLVRMKGLYGASKSTNKRLAEIKVTGEKLVVAAIRTKNATLIRALRMAIMLYVLLRTFTMQHYSK